MEKRQGGGRSWGLWTAVVGGAAVLVLLGVYLLDRRAESREIWWVQQDGLLHQVWGPPQISEGCVEVSENHIICGNFEIYTDKENHRRERILEEVSSNSRDLKHSSHD